MSYTFFLSFFLFLFLNSLAPAAGGGGEEGWRPAGGPALGSGPRTAAGTRAKAMDARAGGAPAGLEGCAGVRGALRGCGGTAGCGAGRKVSGGKRRFFFFS